MKTTNRKQSQNIEDKRNYFGTEANSKMPQKGRVSMFVNESFKSSREYAGAQDYNKFQKPVRGGTRKNRK